jgi:hypothetical protein
MIDALRNVSMCSPVLVLTPWAAPDRESGEWGCPGPSAYRGSGTVERGAFADVIHTWTIALDPDQFPASDLLVTFNLGEVRFQTGFYFQQDACPFLLHCGSSTKG